MVLASYLSQCPGSPIVPGPRFIQKPEAAPRRGMALEKFISA